MLHRGAGDGAELFLSSLLQYLSQQHPSLAIMLAVSASRLAREARSSPPAAERLREEDINNDTK